MENFTKKKNLFLKSYISLRVCSLYYSLQNTGTYDFKCSHQDASINRLEFFSPFSISISNPFTRIDSYLIMVQSKIHFFESFH